MPPTKPWRVDTTKPPPPKPKYGSSLVSSQTVGFPTQRLLVTAVFFLLQGMKLASTKTLVNLVLFSALDVGFVYYLPVFAIPRLNFKPKVVLAQAALLLLLNYSVFVSSDWVSGVLMLALKPVFYVLGITVKTPNAQSPGFELIKGKYIVDILPEATAKLDTIAPLCVDTSSYRADPVYLRLQVDGTWPSVVKMSRAELGNSEKYNRIEYGARKIRGFPQKEDRKELYIPINEPGAYYLDGITDEETGMRVRIQRDRVVIPPCPTAEIVLKSPPQICSNSVFAAEVRATGVSPLTLLLDGEWITLGESLDEDGVATFNVPVEKRATGDVVGASVGEIRDKLGCVSKHHAPGSAPASSVQAHVISPGRAEISPQTLPNVDGTALAQIQIYGEDGPFQVGFEGPDKEFALSFANPGTHHLRVTELGTYRVTTLNGAKCEGTAQGSFDVFEPPAVGLDVDYSVIEDKCAGPSGVDARVRLSGTGPWKVGYRTLKESRPVSQRSVEFTSADDNNVIQFRPKSIGNFTYEIAYVEDRYRHQSLSDDARYSTSQVIKELPGARFGSLTSTKLCGESKASVDVLIRGRGPFTFKYTIDDKQQYEKATEGTKDSDVVKLDLDFDAGVHFIRLVSMTDRNGCVTDLGGVRTPDILVRPHLPTIAFAKPGEYKSAEPVNMSLPLVADHLQYPATVVYEHEYNGRKKQFTQQLSSPADQVPISLPGAYRLLKLDDGVCGGFADQDQQVSVSLYDRPKIELVTAAESSLCHNAGSTVTEFNIIGEAPFVITHEVVDPHGKSHVSKTKVTKHHFSANLDSGIVGEYLHYMWVADSQYQTVQQSQYLKFTHHVWPPAEARFNLRHPHLETCENTALTQRVPVVLKGQAPFQLTVKIGNEIKLLNVDNASQLDLRKEIGFIRDKGDVKLQILDVSDAHGCKSAPVKSGNTLDVTVLPQPQAPALAKSDYCVGEMVSFPIIGKGPNYNLQYKYNNKKRTVKTMLDRKKLDIHAQNPGNITLLSVSDETGCVLETEVTAQVHQLPRSTITEEPHFSIYQGDKISLGFAFEGTAPFSFVYTHSVDGVVKERKEVKNVMENVYTIIVDEGGEYEIVELQDKFCRSERLVL